VHRAYLSLGSNIGDRGEHLTAGVEIVVEKDIFRVSSVYETEPVGGGVQDDYWNMVVELTTSASAYELLARARSAEEARGRVRAQRWGPRTLDVDVLLVGDERSDDPEIVVPHPRMYERSFVLIPLHELAPALVSEAQLGAGAGAVTRLGTLDSLHSES
jgi:2-amino-4-hydroxy-6-hydroxymethyldihydropteridine diphosphokinase